MCSQGVLAVPLLASLRAFSGVDTGAPGIISDWCIYSIHAVYGFFSHLRATSVVVGPLATVPPGDRFLSRPRWARKLQVRLEKYARLSAGTFSA